MNKLLFYTDVFTYVEDFRLLFIMSETWTTYTLMASLGLLFLLADAIALLDFHPSTAIVGGVLKQSASSLYSFLFVFAVFLLVCT
jgi:hypothetical protein